MSSDDEDAAELQAALAMSMGGGDEGPTATAAAACWKMEQVADTEAVSFTKTILTKVCRPRDDALVRGKLLHPWSAGGGQRSIACDLLVRKLSLLLSFPFLFFSSSFPLKVLTNLAGTPSNPKFRKLNTENAKVQRAVALEGATDLLLAAGS